jgi:hypothetical protein
MMKVILLILLVSFCQTVDAAGPPFTPTTCPEDYTCSLQGTGVRSLSGVVSDGRPASLLGFLTFDSSGKVSGLSEINADGIVSTITASHGKCVSGTGGNLGTISLTISSGQSFSLDFVTYVSGTSTSLLLADATSASGSPAEVLIAKCIGESGGT